jgi:hexosaminidase
MGVSDGSPLSAVEPLLVPRPTRLERLGGTFALPAAPASELAETRPGTRFRQLVDEVRTDAHWLGRLGIRRVRSTEVPAGGYRLVLRPASDGHSTMESAGPAGDRAALASVAQLQTQFGTTLPALAIDDAPAFPTRGVMLDVSRDRVPTMPHFQEIIDLLAALKVNHLQLYTEHTFAYPGHEAIWRGCDPITAAEVVEIDGWCKAVGIELAANQNCFGHLHRWLKHPDYAHLAEIVGDETTWDFLGMERTGPFSLCPMDPSSLVFVEELLSELLPHFSSNLINIGCDETADVGQGRSRDAVNARGHRVYTDFVAQVARSAMDKGAHPMFWADIALNNPASLADLPDDLLALAWGYEADTPFDDWGRILGEMGRGEATERRSDGATKGGKGERGRTLGEMGRRFWVCPGTSSWRSITGRTRDRKANLENAATNGFKYKAEGFMVTDWGDGGHRQQWPITLRGLADAADAAWTGWAHGPADTNAVSLHAHGDPTGAVASWLDDLGDADEPLRAVCGEWNPGGGPPRLHNAGALYTDLDKPLDSHPMPGTLDQWRDVQERLDALARLMPRVAEPLTDELAHTVTVARIAADRALARREAHPLPPDLARTLADRLEAASAEHRRLWLMRSRRGGLDASSAHYERTIAELRTAAD